MENFKLTRKKALEVAVKLLSQKYSEKDCFIEKLEGTKKKYLKIGKMVYDVVIHRDNKKHSIRQAMPNCRGVVVLDIADNSVTIYEFKHHIQDFKEAIKSRIFPRNMFMVYKYYHLNLDPKLISFRIKYQSKPLIDLINEGGVNYYSAF